MSKSRDALYEALYDIVNNEDRGMKEGEREKLFAKANDALRKLMYGRRVNGWFDLWTDSMQNKERNFIVEEMMEKIRDDLVNEKTCEYTRKIDEGMNLGYIDWYGDDGIEESPEFEAEFDDHEPDDEVLRVLYVDYERSERFLEEVLEEMDPEGEGYACYPNESVSKSIPESLFYLTGKNGKEGMLSCDWVSPEVKGILWDFVKASWKEWQARKDRVLEDRFFL